MAAADSRTKARVADCFGAKREVRFGKQFLGLGKNCRQRGDGDACGHFSRDRLINGYGPSFPNE